jgi:homoserine kinase type II
MGDVEATGELAKLVSDAWGVTSSAVAEIAEGRMNSHWRVETTAGPFVLRRYTRLRLPESIPAEHTVLESAANAGWPVALPVIALDGERVVWANGALYSLFPFLRGESTPPDSLSHLRIKGRLLARLHNDIGGSLETPRPGFGRAWELDVTLQAAGSISFNTALADFGKEQPDLAAGVRRQRYRNLRELARLGYGDLPSTVIHGDFRHDNLLFSGAELTGLLDFDSVRTDSPAVDLAISIFMDCTLPPDHNALDPQRVGAFVDGYARVRALTDTEVEMLPALLRAAMLMLVAHRLAEWVSGISDRPVKSIERTVTHRLPALDEVTPALLQAVAGAGR